MQCTRSRICVKVSFYRASKQKPKSIEPTHKHMNKTTCTQYTHIHIHSNIKYESKEKPYLKKSKQNKKNKQTGENT